MNKVIGENRHADAAKVEGLWGTRRREHHSIGLGRWIPVVCCYRAGGLTTANKKAPDRGDLGLFSVDLVGRAGVEPTTNGLKVRCSTN